MKQPASGGLFRLAVIADGDAVKNNGVRELT
jgi:hypothetical protein